MDIIEGAQKILQSYGDISCVEITRILLEKTGMPMTEQKKIDWKALHTWQRNQLIAEKILGQTSFICTGKLSYRGDNTMLRHRYYDCQACHAREAVTFDWPRAFVPKEHRRLLPYYSERMDDAWLIVQHFARLPDGTREHWMKQVFLEKLGVVQDGDPEWYDIELPVLASWTPEKICLAALDAYQIEVK
jgi:hypothetical protein